jgi:outer membrane murein-binding lipoprotein Lpp
MRLASQLLLFVVIAAAGCASRGNVDLLEARLRDQEDQLRSLHAQVDRTNSELTAARRLNETLQQKLVQPASHDERFDLSERHFQVSALKINPLLTGGFDRDRQAGDDQITLVFAPTDRSDKPIQAPGRVECELFDRSRPADQQRLGLWSFDSAKTHAAWQKTLGSFGYRFELPWQTAPTSASLELHVRFHSQHGDQFEATTPIRITPPQSTLGADRPMP